MFLPNLMPKNVPHVWRDDLDRSSAFLKRRKQQSSNANGRNQRQLQQQQRQNRKTDFPAGEFRLAPPLSAYSSVRPGATVMEYGASNKVEARMAYLHSIKVYGYNHLKPLGIGKTMQAAIEERNQELQANNTEYTSSMAGTAENMLGDDQQQQQQGTNGLIFEDPSIDHGSLREEISAPQAEGTGFTSQAMSDVRDLDADIQDNDEEEEEDDGVSNEYFSGVFNDPIADHDEFVDEGFMAAEEEYEDDHEDDHEAEEEAEPAVAGQQQDYSDLNSELLQLRSTGNRNISTSTRISSLNQELIHTDMASSRTNEDDSIDRIDRSYYSHLKVSHQPGLRSDLFHLFSDMPHAGAQEDEEEADSDMEIG